MKRYNCTSSDKRGAFGLCMEEHEQGAFVPFSEVDPLNQRINKLLEERNSSGLAISNAILVGVVPDKHPLRSRLELLANHRKMLIEKSELCDDLLDLIERMVSYMGMAGDEPEKDSYNPMKAWMYDAITTMAGQRPKQSVAVTETIRTAPERIWLQVGDQSSDGDYPFPEHHDEVTWCADSVVACEVPYVRADLAAAIPAPVVPEGWKIVPLEPEGEQWGGLARAIIFWMRSYQSNEHTPATLEDFITRLGNTIPDWMKKESEFGDKGHVISKGTAAAFIYKAMLADAPKPPIVKLARFITDGQELELTTVLQSIVNGFSDDPAHDAATLLKRITGEVPWAGDSFQIQPSQGGEPLNQDPVATAGQSAPILNKQPSLTGQVLAGMGAATLLAGLDKESASDVVQLMLEAAEAKGGGSCATEPPSSSPA